MTSTFFSGMSSDSDDDSDYEPAGELFSKEGERVVLNHKGKTEAKNWTSQKLDLYFDHTLKEVKKSEVNLIEAKNQADCLYQSFLEEAASDMELIKSESFPPRNISSENSTCSSDKGCNKESCCFLNANVSIPEKVNETTKDSSSQNYEFKDLKSNFPSNSVSDFNKNSVILSPLSTLKRRDLKSVVGNVYKKKKKETILSISKQDWQNFKEEEDIADELKRYNRGKKGYIERKKFLERSDLRRFEIECQMRLSKKQTLGKNEI